jgi:hypothetical protein
MIDNSKLADVGLLALIGIVLYFILQFLLDKIFPINVACPLQRSVLAQNRNIQLAVIVLVFVIIFGNFLLNQLKKIFYNFR